MIDLKKRRHENRFCDPLATLGGERGESSYALTNEARRQTGVADERELYQELRLALVFNGGVSLAVWMGGAAKEIDRFRCAFSDGSDELLRGSRRTASSLTSSGRY